MFSALGLNTEGGYILANNHLHFIFELLCCLYGISQDLYHINPSLGWLVGLFIISNLKPTKYILLKAFHK